MIFQPYNNYFLKKQKKHLNQEEKTPFLTSFYDVLGKQKHTHIKPKILKSLHFHTPKIILIPASSFSPPPHPPDTVAQLFLNGFLLLSLSILPQQLLMVLLFFMLFLRRVGGRGRRDRKRGGEKGREGRLWKGCLI